MRPSSSFLALFLISAVLFVACDSFAPNELWALRTFKEAIFEDPFLVLSNWYPIDTDPCDWTGITCSPARDHVLKLNFTASSLGGFIAPGIGEISFLQELILHGNNLIGTIPKELGMLKYLKVLDLGMNQLSGPIPPELGNLTNVVKLNLQSNGLSGRLPSDLGNLRFLQELHLDRNRLQGSFTASGHSIFASSLHEMYASTSNITGFCSSSQLKVADFSHNFFVGSVPTCLGYISGLSFQRNCLETKDLNQRPIKQCAGASSANNHTGVTPKQRPTEDNASKHQGASKPSWLSALEVVTGTMVGSLFLVAVLAALWRCNSKPSLIIPWKKSDSGKEQVTAVYVDPKILRDVKRYSREELEVACEDFSNIIGSSPNSLIYKGTIKDGPEIAVISLCIKEDDWTGYLELYYQKEVVELAKLNHENTGKLLGYSRESTPFTRMLVFEYASNGTLYEHLHYGERCQLSWKRRMKIVLGCARGLKYMHTEVEPPFTISELNSRAVYLSEDFSPKLVDFESWETIFERSEKNSNSIGTQGAPCVLPNSLEAWRLDVEGNLSAFGILLLEIISGRPPYCKDKGWYLADWAKDYLEVPEVMSYIVDPELKHFRYEDLSVICEVVNLCINPDTTKRPSMQEIWGMLESRIDTSVSVDLKASSVAWAELALSSSS